MRKNLALAASVSLLALFALSAARAQAAISPLSFALVQKVEFPPEDFTITGARISFLWGENRAVYGLDLGVIGNITEQEFGGIGISGIFNYTQGITSIVGLQFAGIANVNQGKVHLAGLQLAAAVNSNQGESGGFGIQLAGLGNSSPYMSLKGVQIAPYNRAREIYGLQIGIINSVDDLHGLQIGLLNFNRDGLFSVAPFLNFGF